MDQRELEDAWPFAYHMTYPANLARISRERVLRSTASLVRASDVKDPEVFLSTQRKHPIVIQVEGEDVRIRDQKPITAKITHPDGYTRGQYILDLNSRVFFWPGKRAGPRDRGVSHFDAYMAELRRVLRVPMRDVLAGDRWLEVRLSPKNSGASPRSSDERGPDLFRALGAFDRSPGKVVEVTFEGEFALPASTEMCELQPGVSAGDMTGVRWKLL